MSVVKLKFDKLIVLFTTTLTRTKINTYNNYLRQLKTNKVPFTLLTLTLPLTLILKLFNF